MIERLFVYGTLGPGRPNAHILEAVGGAWVTAVVSGTLREEGWGAEMGYPGIDLNGDGGKVEGFVFTSENLLGAWASLDEFEGEGYCRVLVKVELEGGDKVDAYVYALR